MSLLAAINEEVAERLNAAVCKTVDRTSPSPEKPDPRVRIPPSSPNFLKNELSRLEVVFARFIPVRRLALGANPRFADRAFSGHPFMGAPITFIPFLLERDHAHEVTIPR